MPAKKHYESCKYKFTDAELQHLGRDLAEETQTLLDLREQKRSADAVIMAQIKASVQRGGELAGKINDRYEMRDTEVRFLMDTPEPGMKSLVRADDEAAEVLRTEPMTDSEKQMGLPFDFAGADKKERPN